MVTASWNLTSAGRREEVLETVADYARAAEWTPAVRTASKTSPGPLAVGTKYEQQVDIAGGASTFVWKVSSFEPPNSVVLKGKAKVDFHKWYYPFPITVKVKDKYYVQDGPTDNSAVVEYFGKVKVKGLGKLLTPLFKSEWREIKANAREGLARLQGRPAEGALGSKPAREAQATPARGPNV